MQRQGNSGECIFIQKYIFTEHTVFSIQTKIDDLETLGPPVLFNIHFKECVIADAKSCGCAFLDVRMFASPCKNVCVFLHVMM